MQKDFDRWNTIKRIVNTLDPSFLFFSEREIWWCHLGANIGQEQDGKGNNFMRPVLIFKKFNRNLYWVIPLSMQVRIGAFFFPLLAKSNIIRTAILPQLRLIDSKRLIEKIDLISLQEHSFIQEKVIAFIR